MKRSAMECITRNNSNPDSKPRVFVCCDKLDLSFHFKKISSDILSVYDCAVWYCNGGDRRNYTEYWDDLATMQLFIIPITINTVMNLREVGYWRNEYDFAIKNNIPVLYILADEFSSEFFWHEFGNVQYLDSVDTDPTAIPYREKLKKYLNGVFNTDPLYDKVQQAFDGWIFLSYRKKDRAYAKKLIKMIRQNEDCDRIAIWYDEFLIPGEDFTEAIQHTLDNSDFVILAVTPHVLEGGNYIIKAEYPHTRSARKPVIPVEMEETDKEDLYKNFDGLPECISSQDSVAFNKALSEMVEKLGLKNKKHSLYNTYLIGMAYFNGINMEINRTKGIKYLTEAAEGGLIVAIDKLTEIYKSGGGSFSNHELFVYWQKKLINHFKALYTKDPSKANLSKYSSELIDYARHMNNIKKHDECDQTLAELHKIMEPKLMFEKDMIALYCTFFEITAQHKLAVNDMESAGKYFNLLYSAALLAKGNDPSPRNIRNLAIAARLYSEYYKKINDDKNILNYAKLFYTYAKEASEAKASNANFRLRADGCKAVAEYHKSKRNNGGCSEFMYEHDRFMKKAEMYTD